MISAELSRPPPEEIQMSRPPLPQNMSPPQRSESLPAPVVELDEEKRREAQLLALRVYNGRNKDATRTATDKDYENLQRSVESLKSMVDPLEDISGIVFKIPQFAYDGHRINVSINTGSPKTSHHQIVIIDLTPPRRRGQMEAATERVVTSHPPADLPNL